MKAVVAAFNQEKALVGAFSVITNLRMELFQALQVTAAGGWAGLGGCGHHCLIISALMRMNIFSPPPLPKFLFLVLAGWWRWWRASGAGLGGLGWCLAAVWAPGCPAQ